MGRRCAFIYKLRGFRGFVFRVLVFLRLRISGCVVGRSGFRV